MPQGKARTALATLVVGEDYRQAFDRLYRPGWEAYCARHGMALVVLGRLLDPAADLGRKSIHWQKLLVASEPELAGFERVVWVDADIMINAAVAPDITEGVPEDRIGVVDATPWMTARDDVFNRYARFLLLDHLRMAPKRRRGVDYDIIVVADMTIPDMYRLKGFADPVDRYVNSGVFVCSPARHGAFLQGVYEAYDRDVWDFENSAFSYELLRAGLAHFLDPRFNLVWTWHASEHYPFLFDHDRCTAEPGLVGWCVNTAFRNAYFLHLAGGMSKAVAELVDPRAANIAELVMPNYAEAASGIALVSCAEAERALAERRDRRLLWGF
ncbi:hypothetical protein [Arenibaculum pallidiluteum]|uniref:hypothetical protein n=1 Tax=Arenibaculum pallidiluteum TaxID=2812559 RepID=UPI001A978A0E|nr:hypothetical protein [Arenibaculum pallidiluteum]